jgi:hypothetical protein
VLFRIDAVIALATCERVVLEDVHDAWLASMSGQDLSHRSLRPLTELCAEVRRFDHPYLDAIRAVAQARFRQLVRA